jgi:hypothetical protein
VLGGKTLAGKTARVLGSSCYASHMALVTGEPPVTAGFEAPLVFAMQKKPAPKTPNAQHSVRLKSLLTSRLKKDYIQNLTPARAVCSQAVK